LVGGDEGREEEDDDCCEEEESVERWAKGDVEMLGIGVESVGWIRCTSQQRVSSKQEGGPEGELRTHLLMPYLFSPSVPSSKFVNPRRFSCPFSVRLRGRAGRGNCRSTFDLNLLGSRGPKGLS